MFAAVIQSVELIPDDEEGENFYITVAKKRGKGMSSIKVLNKTPLSSSNYGTVEFNKHMELPAKKLSVRLVQVRKKMDKNVEKVKEKIFCKWKVDLVDGKSAGAFFVFFLILCFC